MNLLSVDKLSKTYGDKVLFEEISFGLHEGDKTALIAGNGTGKSTLFKILAGKDFADSGSFAFRDGLRVAYLEQQPEFEPGISLKELIDTHDSEIRQIIRDYEEAVKRQAEKDTPETREQLNAAINRMDKAEAWDYDRRLTEMFSRFGITRLEQKTETLSGGQKKRIALALTLLDQPEFLLLDEPTNHLDIDMIEWLEKYLSASDITLFMVTHDRYFLDRICNNIMELSDSQIYTYQGNYSYFLEKRAARIEAEQSEREKAEKWMKKELEWLRRMPKARTHKSKARIDAFYETKAKASKKTTDDEIKLQTQTRRLGGKIIEIKNIEKHFGDKKIVENFSYIFKKGERIGLLGKNGVGKSTFLNLLTGKTPPDKGEIIRGDTVSIGYYTQEGLKASPDKTVLEVVKDIAEVIQTGKNKTLTASQFLNYFLFPPKVQQTPVSKLSGGERRRLYLLTVLITNPNFLILDEPTNDLDIVTLNKLEAFLSDFQGCLILVSHDRYFLDRLTDHLFIFEGNGKIKDFYGNYTSYRFSKLNEEKKNKPAEKKPAQPKVKQNNRKLSYKEKREFEQLETEIEQLEKEKAALESTMNTGNLSYQELEETGRQIARLMETLDEKTLRWMELAEKANP
ncbi:ABC-F family ATP-binding cassette domain-containing protein [Candidatus Sulfidibacterium hydrothermale]|uniref:ABC-F family ATP-binding cassette domain-containing protein n=1 Tax=Candidatus Sulfidibacterium hydrothermale TaxID=2875962 RepID=UPI001F0A5C4B|nr:ABC-F family ATP-binding cassette domain-containing protein [Candidatus Sulfidibacterium hydrothermale]UBM61091.1 ABC-F family ATP-binding cassette domain-containing protein [Candidatus Sulfidibacterium hydrothermale]